MIWVERKYWSIMHGGDVARISACRREDGREYFAVVDLAGGRKYRERRDEVLDILERAIDRGDDPGEVRL